MNKDKKINDDDVIVFDLKNGVDIKIPKKHELSKIKKDLLINYVAKMILEDMKGE